MNREIAEKLLRSLWAWDVAKDDPCDNYSDENIEADTGSVEQALKAAERRGKIELLERLETARATQILEFVPQELDRLRAEAKEER